MPDQSGCQLPHVSCLIKVAVNYHMYTSSSQRIVESPKYFQHVIELLFFTAILYLPTELLLSSYVIVTGYILKIFHDFFFIRVIRYLKGLGRCNLIMVIVLWGWDV